MTRFITGMLKNILVLLVSAWFIMLFEGDIGRLHSFYTVGFGETILGLIILGNIVSYATNAALGMAESRD